MRYDTAVPTSVTITNNMTTPIRVAGFNVAAGASGVVLDLSKRSLRAPFGDPNTESKREEAWSEIVLAARVTTARPTALITITATVPATLVPALSAAVDYTGPRHNGVSGTTVYGNGAVDTVTFPANTPRTALGGAGAGTGPGAADTSIRTN